MANASVDGARASRSCRLGLWKGVAEFDDARILERGEALFAISDDVGRARRLTGLQRENGLDLFAVTFVRHADDRRFGHRGMRIEDFFDLARVDVESAAQDHVLLAIDDEVITLVVARGDVARVKPSVLQGL